MPLPHEAQIQPLLSEILADGKCLLLPSVSDNGLTFHQVSRLQSLREGQFRVMEPSEDALQVPLEQAELILVPLEAVDRRGNRLGKGGGYYDRALRTVQGFCMGRCVILSSG